MREVKQIWLCVTGLMVALLLLSPAQLVWGQAAAPGQALEISPPLVERSVDPGQLISFPIRIRNISRERLITKAQFNDFVAGGEDGEPKLLTDPGSTETSPYSLKEWVSPIVDLDLVSREAKTTQVRIQVPKDASPGGHYGVIRFTGVPPGLSETGVALSASIGTLVLLNVSGDVEQKATVAEFFAQQQQRRSSWFEYGPISLVARIRNEGNVHLQPKGDIKVTNIWGRKVGELAVNADSRNILPASIRRFEQTLDKKMLFGRYQAKLDLTYANDQKLSQTISFWVIPYKLVAIALLALLALIFGGRYLLGRYKRKVLAQAGRK